MKVGVFSAILSDLPLDRALQTIAGLGCDTVELGTGAYPGDAHCRPAELLASKPARDEFLACIRDSGLEISSLSCHGNPLHPDKKIAHGFSARSGMGTVRTSGAILSVPSGSAATMARSPWNMRTA